MHRTTFSRRKFIKTGSVMLAAPALMRARPALAQDGVFKIGLVAPTTGPLAGFGEAQDWIIAGLKDTLAGITNNGAPVTIEIIAKDSQSNPNRAAEVASELILSDGINLMLTHATPDTTNPVADQCELNEIPCISTNCPWQPYFFGRGGNPEVGFNYTYHFFWGLEDIIANFTAIWDQSGVAKKVGALFPNDADGNAWGDPQLGLPGPLAAAGYELIDPGRYQPMNNDFSSQIAAFKAAGCEIVTGVMIPPDFATFWSQAAQQGFNPKVVTIGKALLFPSSVDALADRGDGLTTEIWWTPDYPFSSSLTGMTARQLGDAYVAESGKPWTATLGFSHAIFEVGLDVVKRATDLSDTASIMEAIKSTNLNTMVGPINWANGPMKNITKTPMVGGQWKRRDGKLELVIVNNKQNPDIPVTGDLTLLG
ncbi:ABC transporter substrate-binding protein [Tabrizicola sp.]|uniref:ABC transporter substrate-binding protein n=1 Tax=Tabrizicola sp. TaxID=2005166 RepID=UPI003F2ACC61